MFILKIINSSIDYSFSLATQKLYLALLAICCLIVPPQAVFSIKSSSGKKKASLSVKQKKPKIVILSSRGGYSHVAASKIITRLLKSDYDIEIVYIFDEIVKKIFPYSKKFLGITSGEKWYNGKIQKDKLGMLRLAISLFKNYIACKKKAISEIIDSYLEEPHNVMLISLVPFINGSAMLSAKRKSIPLLIVSLDPSLKNWVLNIKKPIYKNTHLLLAYRLARIYKSLKKVKWPTSQYDYAGLAVRDQFYEAKENKKECKRRVGINPDHFTVMIMKGGNGCLGCYEDVQELIKKGFQGHIIVAAGRDKVLLKKLQNLKLPKGLTANFLGFTYEIAPYMAAADVLLTKPGPTAFHEAIILGLPLLIDHSKAVLVWERPLINLIKDQKLGIILYRKEKLFATIENLRKDPRLMNRIQVNISRYREQLPKFEEVFLKIMKKLLKESKNGDASEAKS